MALELAPIVAIIPGLPGGVEMIVILIIALLLFGRRLPEVMRPLGSGVVEFKKGIKGIEDEVEVQSSRPAPTPAATESKDPAAINKPD